MNDPVKRIAALYSRGPHYEKMLCWLREQHPRAEIVALTPPGFPAELLGDLIHEARSLPEAATRPGALAGFLALARSVRAGRFDGLAVMFDSPRLRLVAALSGARLRLVYTADSRTIEMRGFPAAYLLRETRRRLMGRLRHAWVRWVIQRRPVEEKRS